MLKGVRSGLLFERVVRGISKLYGSAAKAGVGMMALDELVRQGFGLFRPAIKKEYVIRVVNGRPRADIPRADGSVMEICYFVDSSLFAPVAEKLSPIERALIFEAELYATEIEKQAPRFLSGLDGASHVRGVASDYVALCNELGIQPKTRMIIMGLTHDSGENHPTIKSLVHELEDIKGRERKIDSDFEEMKEVVARLGKARKDVNREYVSRLRQVLDRYGISQPERNELESIIERSARGVDTLTRYVEKNTYAHSIFDQLGVKGKKVRDNEHKKVAVGTVAVLETAEHIVIKSRDSIRNDTELQEDPNLAQVCLLFNDGGTSNEGVISEYFTGNFGNVLAKGSSMARTARLRRVLGDIFKLQQINTSLNNYGAQMKNGEYGKDGVDSYSMIVYASRKLREASLALTESAMSMYSEREIGASKGAIGEKVGQMLKHGTYFDGFTPPADPSEPSFVVLNKMDSGGKKFFDQMDATEEGRLYFYTALAHCKVVLQRFGNYHYKNVRRNMSTPIEQHLKTGLGEYDPEQHKMFTLLNSRAILSTSRIIPTNK